MQARAPEEPHMRDDFELRICTVADDGLVCEQRSTGLLCPQNVTNHWTVT